MFLIIYRGKKLSRTKPNGSNHKTFNHIEDDDDDDNEDFGVLGSGSDSRALQPLTLRAILRLSGRDLERVGLPDFVYILYRFQLFGPLGIRLALSRASRPMGCGHGTLFFWCSDFFFFLIVTM